MKADNILITVTLKYNLNRLYMYILQYTIFNICLVLLYDQHQRNYKYKRKVFQKALQWCCKYFVSL
jgi:hypothetical protein